MAIARHGPEEQATPYQKVEASALGGAIAGATVAGLTRMYQEYSSQPRKPNIDKSQADERTYCLRE